MGLYAFHPSHASQCEAYYTFCAPANLMGSERGTKYTCNISRKGISEYSGFSCFRRKEQNVFLPHLPMANGNLWKQRPFLNSTCSFAMKLAGGDPESEPGRECEIVSVWNNSGKTCKGKVHFRKCQPHCLLAIGSLPLICLTWSLCRKESFSKAIEFGCKIKGMDCAHII